MISPTLTSLLSQRRQFDLNCEKNIALKIVALFTENYPSPVLKVTDSSKGKKRDLGKNLCLQRDPQSKKKVGTY